MGSWFSDVRGTKVVARARMWCEKLRTAHTWPRPTLGHLEAKGVVIWALQRNQVIETDGWA